MLRVIDLFCGAGGFSEGFKQAGYEIVAAVDNWETAIESHEANHPEATHFLMNIEHICSSYLREFKADLIIGGPPCVNFSVANTSPKVEQGLSLVAEFLEITKDLNLPFLFENVPGSYKDLTKFFDLRGRAFNSVNFGVPQKRERIFYSDLFFEPLFTHHEGKETTNTLFGEVLHPAVTVNEILEEPIEEELKELQPSVAVLRRLEKTIRAHSKKKRLGGFAYVAPVDPSKPMQTMLAHHNTKYVVQKTKLPTSLPGFAFGTPIDAEKPSQTIMAKDMRFYVVYTGFPDRNGSNIKDTNEPNFTLQSQPDHFLTNKGGWRHFSLTELKRIMGFPDDYIITGSRNAQGRQLGNAVCPPVAKAIAEALKPSLLKLKMEVKS